MERTRIKLLIIIGLLFVVPMETGSLPTNTAFRSFQLRNASDSPGLELEILDESVFMRGLTVFLSSLPLTMTYSLLSYKWYKIFSTGQSSYPLSRKETLNVLLCGCCLSLFYTIVDLIIAPREVRG